MEEDGEVRRKSLALSAVAEGKKASLSTIRGSDILRECVTAAMVGVWKKQRNVEAWWSRKVRVP